LSEDEVRQAVSARLEALDREDLSAVVEFYTEDADVDTRGLDEIGGRFHGREQIVEFYRVLFEGLPEVRRTAENVRLSVSEGDALAAYDVRVEEQTEEGTEADGGGVEGSAACAGVGGEIETADSAKGT